MVDVAERFRYHTVDVVHASSNLVIHPLLRYVRVKGVGPLRVTGAAKGSVS